mgnify:CR=1 FL=1
MSMSDTNQARRYASIAEVAAAQAKISADKLDGAPAYAEQAAASASAAANSAQAAISAEIVVNVIAAQANQSAISAAESAAQAGDAAGAAIGRSLRVPEGELLSELPEASSRANTVPIFDVNSNAATKSLSEFAIIDSVSGKLPVSIIPSVALTVPFVVSDQDEMLALSAQIGDVAKRTDLGYSFMLGAEPASTLSNWVQLTDNVLTQLSQPSGASMIGAKDDEDNPTTVQQLLDAKASTASLSANSGATTIGATNLSGGGVTVQQSLTSLNQSIAALTAKDGFNLVGRFLNLSELRAKAPEAAGQIVYVASAASATATEKHYGGGYFQSFDNSTSPIADDGGIVIVPATGTLAWRRINFTEYDMCFWGVKPDGVTDNASVITKACDYARENKAKLLMPSGVVKSSESLNIYSETAIIGSGKNKTTFKKTTNNGFPITGGPTIDALVVFVPNKYDHDSADMSSFCFLPRLEGMTLTRENLTDSNMNYYGLWLDKSAMPIIKDIRTEGAYIGLEGTNSFGVNIESTQIIGLYGKGNIGFLLSNYVSPNFWLSGTSVSARLLSVVNYQIGFEIDGLQYSSFDCCTAEVIIPLTGTSEQKSYAFRFINPYCISMTSCATEGVKGTQVQAILQSNVSFKASLKIENYLAIDQINPIVPMKYMEFDSGNVGALSIQIIGGDLSRDNTLTNLLQTTASGTNCVVCNVGSWIDGVTTSGGADYRTI